MRNRIDKLGVSEPEIRKQGYDQIVIQLAGVHDPAAAAKLIGKTAVLAVLRLRGGPDRAVGDVAACRRCRSRPAASTSCSRRAGDTCARRQGQAVAVVPLRPEQDASRPGRRRRKDLLHEQIVGSRRAKGGLARFRRTGRVAARPAEHRRRQLRPGLDRRTASARSRSRRNKAFYLLKHRLPDARATTASRR